MYRGQLFISIKNISYFEKEKKKYEKLLHFFSYTYTYSIVCYWYIIITNMHFM